MTTPLGIATIPKMTEQPVIATILRASLPLHIGLLNYFDQADNAFVSAYRKHSKDGSFVIKLEYMSSPKLEGRTLILCDPMLATGQSMLLTYKEMMRFGKPKHTHLVSVIASRDGVEFMKAHMRPSIRVLLACVYNPNITFPDYSDVKWKPLRNERGITDTNLDKEARKIYIFANGPNLSLERKKAKLIQMLEGMHVDDADLFYNWILQKKLPYSKISTSFITKNFPEILSTIISPAVYNR